ncbi:MAG: hypothetical protein ACXWC9_08215 [Pseudobdellovibrionaceae bacterium]
MKTALLLLQLFFVLAGTAITTQAANAADLCTGPFHQAEVCERMRYMKASINVLDGQREMVRINYPYLAAVGSTMKDNVISIMNIIDLSEEDHLLSLKKIKEEVTELEVLAKNENIKASLIANNVRKNCVACHSGERPESGVSWGDVFYYDWEKVSSDCNSGGGNPYICRSMNGLLTAYSHILTEMKTGVTDFEVLRLDSLEIVRIFSELKKANALHMNPQLAAKAELEAREIADLADKKDPVVFEKAVNLSTACTTCHTEFGRRDNVIGPINIWRTKL